MKKLNLWEPFLGGFVPTFFVIALVSCMGSPEPRNPLTKPAEVQIHCAKPLLPEPTSVRCLRCDRKDTTKNNPYLTDEEKKILKRTEEDLDDLEWGVEKEEKKKVY